MGSLAMGTRKDEKASPLLDKVGLVPLGCDPAPGTSSSCNPQIKTPEEAPAPNMSHLPPTYLTVGAHAPSIYRHPKQQNFPPSVRYFPDLNTVFRTLLE